MLAFRDGKHADAASACDANTDARSAHVDAVSALVVEHIARGALTPATRVQDGDWAMGGDKLRGEARFRALDPAITSGDRIPGQNGIPSILGPPGYRVTATCIPGARTIAGWDGVTHNVSAFARVLSMIHARMTDMVDDTTGSAVTLNGAETCAPAASDTEADLRARRCSAS